MSVETSTETSAEPTAAGPADAPSGEPPSARQVAGRRWRRTRGILIAVGALAVVAVVLAIVQPRTERQYLDPESPSRDGSRALAQITSDRGTPVTTVRNAGAAAQAMRDDPNAVLVIVRTDRLLDRDLEALRAAPGDRVIVQPDTVTLRALAPGVRLRAPDAFAAPGATTEPECNLPAAQQAGKIAFGEGDIYEAPAGATGCYEQGDGHHLVQMPQNDRTVSVLGSGQILTNQRLDEQGNAALGMNLLGAKPKAVWLIPDLPKPGSAERKSFYELVPFGVKLAVLQLFVAVILVALWRSRRLGRVITEPLPVVVRSSEAVEGRARLYRARSATDRAAGALRAGALERMVPFLGMPRSAATDPSSSGEIARAIAARTGHGEAEAGAALYGPPPGDDAGLVALADFLDDLERQIRQS